MKGTLFSADFIKDNNGNLRLLELNTDTGFVSQSLNQMDYSDLIEILSTNSITELVVIHKLFQNDFVSHLSQSIHSNASFITTFTTEVEEVTTIYPTAVTDDTSKFILRLAYDESAVFDSEYTKNTTNVLNLFTDNSDSGSIVEYYYSSSVDGVTNYLPKTFNSTLSPDIISKSTNVTTGTPLKFIKLSKSSETDENRYSELISSSTDSEVLLKFYENTGSVVESIRAYSIIYGSNLNLIHLGSFLTPAILEKPTILDSGSFGDTNIRNEINVKHYFEFTTNSPRYGTAGHYGGVFEEEEIQKADGTYIQICSASVGDEFKSYFVSGSPNTDLETEYSQWTYPGSEVPSGSYETSSILINNIEDTLTYNLVNRITLEGGDEFRISGASYLLIYDSNLDVIKYKSAADIIPSIHKLLGANGQTISITTNTIDVLDGTYHVHIVDMETTDTFFLKVNGAQIKIVTHNCFPAGTKITMSDGSFKNIEEIKSGDSVLSYNFEKDGTESGVVTTVKKSAENLLVELSLEDDTVISSTALHRIYTKEREWVHAQDIEVGDTLLQDTGKELKVLEVNTIHTEVDVYQLIDVKDNHNYYANTMLVHNFKYGCFSYETEVEMWDGTRKQIGKVEVGDIVKSIKDGEVVKGIVTQHLTHPINDVVPYTTVNSVTGTPDHPVFINNKWVEFGSLSGVQNGFKFIDNFYNLEIDGNTIDGSAHNYILNGIVVSGLGDNKVLNQKFQRQSLETLTKSGIL